MTRFLKIAILGLVLVVPAQAQEGCGRWQPVDSVGYMEIVGYEQYGKYVFYYIGPAPDSVFVPEKCPEASPDTACWGKRWVIGNCWEPKVVDHRKPKIDYMVWRDPGPPDTCWHLERYKVPCDSLRREGGGE